MPAASTLLHAVEHTLATLAPGGVAVAAVALAEVDPLTTLVGCEPGLAADMVPARRLELAAGRTAARRCLARLGVTGALLGAGIDRGPFGEPRWPAGVVGAISHDSGLAVAVAAPADDCGGLGVDLVDADALTADLWSVVLLDGEAAWAGAQPAPGRAATAVFAAKEAVIKVRSPLERALIEPRSFALAPLGADGSFDGRGVQGRGVQGRLTVVGRGGPAGDLVLAVAWGELQRSAHGSAHGAAQRARRP